LWRSRVSHGAIVRSGRISKLASEPSSPPWASRRGSGVGSSPRRRDSGRPTSGGGASRSQQTSHVGKASRKSVRPPSTRTMPRVRSGWRTAKSRTTPAPHDWPARTGRSKPSARDQRPQVLGDRGEVVAAVRLVGVAVAAQVDRAATAARPPRAARATPSHSPRVRGQAVDEQERQVARRRRPPFPPPPPRTSSPRSS
jgi:hypothetical protein